MSHARDRTAAVRRIEAPADAAGLRIDVFLAKALPELSRSRIQHLTKGGLVTAGGRKAKPGAIVTAGTVFEVAIPTSTEAAPRSQDLPLELIYQDSDLVVVDKPVGMVVHPAAGHADGTLVNALLHHIQDLSGIGGTERPGIVHRLDRGTSGVMVVAKHDQSHRHLSAQFHDRTVTKEYLALVWGHPEVGLQLDRPIGRHPVHRQKMSGRSRRGRVAVTTVLEVEALGAWSLVRVTIGTGRTHQIRVHLSEAGHPIVGDELYGGTRRTRSTDADVLKKLTRPFLHSARLGITHPRDGRRMVFEAPLDQELSGLLQELRSRRQPPSTEVSG